jgi:hypothetical protein
MVKGYMDLITNMHGALAILLSLLFLQFHLMAFIVRAASGRSAVCGVAARRI